jgi:transposase-like protein
VPGLRKEREGNIVLKEHYGKQNTALLRCKTCKKIFSENRGTPFFGLHKPKEMVLRSMAMLVEKGSIRGTARAMGANKDSVALWLKRAGEHCEEVTEYLLRDLNLSQVQIDEIWTFIKKREKSEAR